MGVDDGSEFSEISSSDWLRFHGNGAAKSCIRAGLDVYGIDLNPVALEDLGNAGAKGVSTDANQFAQNLDAVLLLVINAKQVKSVLFDSGLAANLNRLLR